MPQLDRQPEDITVSKRQWGAFYGTGLDMELRRRGVTQIVLCGISTSIGVESTARDAYEHGYHVAVATDAVTDTDAASHERSVTAIFPRLGGTGSAADVLLLGLTPRADRARPPSGPARSAAP